jgi:hypothetical protein
MKTVFARALVALVPFAVVALPASAFATTKPTHNHTSVAKKEPKKKSKHHGHKASSKTPATTAVTSKAP